MVRSGVLQHTLPVTILRREAAVNQDVKVLIPKTGIVPEYLAFYLMVRGSTILPLVTKHSTTVQSVNVPQFDNLLIPVPPPKLQQLLVDDLRAARNARDAKLVEANALLNGIDDLVLGELDLEVPAPDGRYCYAVKMREISKQRCDAAYYLPKFRRVAEALSACSLPKVPLGQLAASITGGATPLRAVKTQYANEGIRFLRIQNITLSGIDLADIKYITEDVHNGLLGRSKLEPGDVLMTITGRIGTAAVVEGYHLPANINQHIVRIRLADKRILPEFLVCFLNSPVGTALSNRGVTGTTRIALDYETIRQIPILLPPAEAQQRIVSEIAKRKEQVRRVRAEAAALWTKALEDFESKLLIQGTEAQ